MDFRNLIDVASGNNSVLHENTLFELDFSDDNTARLLELSGITGQMLLENRIQWLRDNIMHKLEDLAEQEGKTKEELFDYIVDLDPDPKKKNTQWLFKILVGKHGQSGLKDLKNAPDVLTKFADLKKEGKLDKRFHDLNQFTSINALKNTIDAVESDEQDKEDIEYKRALNQSELIKDIDDYLILKPNTTWAAQYWGKETDWCTAYGCPGGRNPDRDFNSFEDYNRRGSLYVIWNKSKPEKTYQLFVPNSIADQKDGLAYEFRDYNNVAVSSDTEEKLRKKFPVIDELIKSAKEINRVSVGGKEYTAEEFYDLIEEFSNEEDIDYDFYDELIEEGSIIKIALKSAGELIDSVLVPFLKYAIDNPVEWEDVVISAVPDNSEAAAVFANLYKDGRWEEYENQLLQTADSPNDWVNLRSYMSITNPTHWKKYRSHFEEMDITTASMFAIYVLEKPMPEIEERLLEKSPPVVLLQYIQGTGRGEWKEAEEVFKKLDNSYYLNRYRSALGDSQ